MADNQFQAAKNQLNAFRLRPANRNSSPIAPNFQFPAPATPRSSESSITSLASMPPLSAPSSPISHMSTSSSSSSNRPLSHHRRKSSVSTRRESNEIMGFVPPPEVEDQASRDEVRKRALLALEGNRPVLTGFAKVEIPDWDTPTHDSKGFDWDLPKIPAPNLTNSLAGKRDSFGRSLVTPSISGKAELHTLVEEDEEEDEDVSASSKVTPMGSPRRTLQGTPVPTTHITEPSPLKPRPASLSLRALSLVGDLPTPTATPSPRAGMRPFNLSTSPSSSVFSSISSSDRYSLPPSSPSSPSPAHITARRQSQLAFKRASPSTDLNTLLESTLTAAGSPPTPSRTPQSSISSASSSPSERPMSPTEVFAQQAYTIQNHASLLARIADLEDALASAQAKSSASNDELIALVADLKAERDALHATVDAQAREIGEMQRSAELVKKRLEGARAEAWVEKDRADALKGEVNALKQEKVTWTKERDAFLRESEERAMEVEM